MGNMYSGKRGAGLEVTEVDGSPDVQEVSKIVVSNGTLTDDGSGQVTITTGGGGGGVTLSGSTATTVATVTGANALQGEANLTFTGTQLTVTGSAQITSDLEIDGALNHDGTTVGFYGVAPVSQGTATGYTGSVPPGPDTVDLAALDGELLNIGASIGTIITLLQDLGLSA
tara:strand:- start:145 stop:657 length:513 start_codon:yes stop_codon:yes gene_type:complete